MAERFLLFIPMYNCERQIPRVVRQFAAPEVSRHFDEVIIVDNRSRDGSRRAAIETLTSSAGPRVKVLENSENYGLGGSHKVAFDYAIANGFDYCVVLHGDDQGCLDDIMPLIRRGAHRDVDCLLGARFMDGSKLEGYSSVRTFGNKVFNAFYSLVSRHRIYDLGAGLNLYSVKALADRQYLRNADDLTFNYHMILHSIADRWRIRFFPILWREEDQVSNVKLLQQAMRVLAIALEYAFWPKKFLLRDYSRLQGQPYSAMVLFDSAVASGLSNNL